MTVRIGAGYADVHIATIDQEQGGTGAEAMTPVEELARHIATCFDPAHPVTENDRLAAILPEDRT